MARTAYTVLDVACPRCNAPPGLRCRAVGQPQRRLATAHALRTVAARHATEAITGIRRTASTSDAWTCSPCGKTYWPPAGWEPRVWEAARDAAQLVHGRRHREEQAAADS
jgi:hypothetical protein